MRSNGNGNGRHTIQEPSEARRFNQRVRTYLKLIGADVESKNEFRCMSKWGWVNITPDGAQFILRFHQPSRAWREFGRHHVNPYTGKMRLEIPDGLTVDEAYALLKGHLNIILHDAYFHENHHRN